MSIKVKNASPMHSLKRYQVPSKYNDDIHNESLLWSVVV